VSYIYVQINEEGDEKGVESSGYCKAFACKNILGPCSMHTPTAPTFPACKVMILPIDKPHLVIGLANLEAIFLVSIVDDDEAIELPLDRFESRLLDHLPVHLP